MVHVTLAQTSVFENFGNVGLSNRLKCLIDDMIFTTTGKDTTPGFRGLINKKWAYRIAPPCRADSIKIFFNNNFNETKSTTFQKAKMQKINL